MVRLNSGICKKWEITETQLDRLPGWYYRVGNGNSFVEYTHDQNQLKGIGHTGF